MKTGAVVYVGSLGLSLAIILATAFLSVDARAGSVSQKTGTSATRTPTPAPPGRGEYKLVFPSGYDVPVKPKGAGWDSSRDSKFDNFIERLNEAGREGFRLISFVYDGSRLPVGLVRKAGVSYEYTWLFTPAEYGLQVTPDFDKKYPELSEQGFRLADFSKFENDCHYPPGDTTEPGSLSRVCYDAYVFLFEREKGAARPARYAVARRPGSDADYPTEIKRILADGLAPKHVLPVYRFWFEPTGTGDGRWGGGAADIEVVSEAAEAGTWRRSTFKKKIKELAQRGYRAAMLDWGLALMHRARGHSAAYSYVWVEADGGLEKQLVQLQAKGAVYLKTYKKEDQLIFEQRVVDDGARYEYKVLRFKFGKADDAAGAHVRVELAPPSKETLKAFERLVGEGFAVRDLFLSGGRVGVILERPL